jgi:hypothetical protein
LGGESRRPACPPRADGPCLDKGLLVGERDAWNHAAADPLQQPFVDVVVPPGTTQEDGLKDDDIQAKRPVSPTAVVPVSL